MIRSGRHSPAAFVLSLILGLFLFVSFVFTPVLAATTDTISFQSKLVNADGTNIANNTYNFRFRIFSVSSGGTALWSEDRSLPVTDGVVSAQLGAVTSFGATLFDNADLYLQICFDANGTVGDSSDANCDTVAHRYEEVFSTRKPITAVPLAFRAKALTDGAGNSFGPNSFFQQGGNAFGAAAVLGTTDNNTLTFKTNNAAAVTILTSGYVGIGTTGPSYPLHVVATTTTTAAYAAGFSNTGADTGDTYENGILVSSVSTTGTGVSNAGYQAGAYINTALSGNGTLDILRGLWINNSAGQSSGTGTVTNHYGIDVDINQGTGVNTNAYGIRIRDVEGTNDYGIYQEGADDSNYFAGNVGIGVAGPGAKLEVLGTADDQQLIVRANGTQTANLQEWQANAGTVYSQIRSDGSFLYSRTGLTSTDVYGVKSSISGTGNRTRAYEAQVTYTGVGYDLTGGNTAGAYYGYAYSAAGTGTGAMASFIAGATATGTSTNIGQYIGFLGKAPVEVNSGTINQAYGLYLNDFNVATTNYAILTNAGNVVFNEGGDAATDFRVEGDVDANLLFTDASADNIGIGTGTPGQKLSIAGTLGIIETGVTPTYYTIFQGGDQAADITYTLPTASSNGVLTNTGGVLSWAAGGGSGDITDVGSMISGAAFADATADDDWLGLGAAAGRIEFDDQAIDEVNILSANVGIGTSTPAHLLDIAGGTLADQKYALRVTATMPATPTAMQNGIYFDITGSGTAAQTSIATRIDYKAGYTGSSGTRALLLTNANAGTGNNLQLSAAGTSPTSNTGMTAIVNPTTTGLNIGIASLAENGNLNIGLFGRATIAKNSATNIGVSGFALNTGTSPIHVGGYFGLQNATPTVESAALIADNGTQTSPIFLGRDNGSIVFGIYDGGGVDIAGHLAVGASASISTANVILVEETFNTASPISGIYSLVTNTATGAVGIAPAIQTHAVAKNPYGGYFEATANDATGTARGGYFEGESGLNNTGVMAFGRSGSSGATIIGGFFEGEDSYDNASAVYGLQARAYAGSASTAVYGIYIDVDNYAASNEYAIYSPGAAKSLFGGNVITDGALAIAEAGVGGDYTYFQGGTQSGSITYTLPVNAGTSGQVLSSNGSGVLSWINNGALYSSSNTVSSGSYLTVAHNQATNDLMSSAWYYDSIASQWRTIDNAGSKTIKHALQNEWDDAATAGKIRVNTRLTNVELAPSINTGTGADGAITISGDKSINSGASSISGRTCTDVGGTGGDAPYYSITALSSNTATLATSPSNPGCLKAGDEVLLINLQGSSSTTTTNVGNYETLIVSSISTNTVTFTQAKTKYYGDGATNDTNIGTGATNQKVMLQRVPNYTNVTVNSTINFYPDAYDYSTGRGGVMFFRATGTVTVSGTIHANAKGYIGGVATTDITATRATPGQSLWYTTDTAGRGGLADANSPGKDGGNGAYSGGGGGGKSLTSAGGSGGTSSSTTGAGGGGAGGHAARVSGTFPGVGGGGGGGGYGTAGNGGTGSVNGGNGSGSASGAGGAAGISTYNYGGGGGGGASNYGSATLGNLFMGSGGGAGGTGQNAAAVEYSGTDGGRGGGIVLIAANTVTVSGGVQSNGQQASASSNQLGACGGSGAGGSIRIEGSALSLGITKVTASGGAAQTTTCNKTGGGGGAGRIAAYYASTNSGTTAPDASSTQVAYNTYGLYHSAPISTTNAIAFEDIRWEGNLNTYGKLQVQTRSGNSTTPTDGTWEPWKPAVASTNYVSLHTANTHTLWTGTNATVAEGDVTRNIDMFEDEDEATATNVAKITSSTNGGYAGADVESGPINISGYSYITFWVRASQPGNTLKIGFGETAATEQEQNITIDATDTWQKVYWDISGIASGSRDAVNKLRITNLTTASNIFYIDNMKAEELGATMTGTSITSTPNNYLQYRIIFTTTNTSYPPQLENVYVTYNNGYKVVQADNNTVRLYNYTGKSQDLRLSVGTATGSGSSAITVGSMTGSSLFSDANADDDWFGLGASAGRIEFDDQTTDEVNILAANVGIGTSTPNYNLHVSGDTYISGQVGIGTASPTAGTILNIANSYSGELNRYGIVSTLSVSNAVLSASQVYYGADIGAYTSVTSNGAYNQTVHGANITAGNSSTGTVTALRGVVAVTDNQNVGGTVSSAFALWATVNNTGGGTVANGYGVYIADISATNGFGLYQIGSNDYNYFAGNVGIGTNSPASFSLQVAGNIGPNANDTYDLGSTSLRFRDLYLGGDTLHIGTSTSDEGILSYDTTNNILNIGTDSTTAGDIALSTDILYIDKSTQQIGMGTTTPSRDLTLRGTTGQFISLEREITMAANYTLGSIEYTGIDPDAGSVPGVLLLARAAADWTSTSAESELVFYTTASGSLTRAIQFIIEGGGRLYMGTAPSTTGTTALCWDNAGASYINDCNGSATDIAEYYKAVPDVEPGDVVAHDSDAYLLVKKTEGVNDMNVAGIISTNPSGPLGDVMGEGTIEDADNPVPLALVGRVPTKVNLEGGSIAIGDLLTLSTVPGVAKKYTGTGITIGRALEAYDGTQQLSEGVQFIHQTLIDKVKGGYESELDAEEMTQAEVNSLVAPKIAEIMPPLPPEGIGKIMVNVGIDRTAVLNAVDTGSSFWTGISDTAITTQYSVATGNLTSTLGEFNVLRTRTLTVNDLLLVDDLGNLTTTGKVSAAAISTSTINSVDGLVNVSLKGNDLFKVTADGTSVLEASVQGVKVNNLVVTDQQAGRALIKAGDSQIIVKSTLVTADSVIMATPNKPVITAATPATGEFTITLDKVAVTDVEVAWYVVNVSN